MRKLLALTESSHLDTGYGVVARQVLSRLHERGNLEIYELASHGRHTDQPWKFQSVLPETEEARKEYESNPLHAFGGLVFEEACCRFRPDIVWSYRDPWMSRYVADSPFRDFYVWVNQTPVDAEPQSPEWLEDFAASDHLTTYTRWGMESLRRQAPGLPFFGPVGLGVDTSVFRPIEDRASHRRSLGLDENALVVGMVARNQKRKLFPDLLEAFRTYLDTAPDNLRGRTYLYLHTYWPDIGWNLPWLLSHTGTASRVLFSYACKGCGKIFLSFWQDARAFCRGCGQPNASLVHAGRGVPPAVLAGIYGAMDVYVQLHCAEGFGIPAVEAAACGVPLVVTDYAGTSDFVQTLGARPVPPLAYWWESDTHRRMAVPDRAALVEALVEALRMPAGVREGLSRQARQGVLEHYDWDRIACQWEEVFLGVPLKKSSWDGPPRYVRPADSVPEGLDNSSFVSWGFRRVACRPDLVDSARANAMLRDLTWGASMAGGAGLGHGEHSVNSIQPLFSEFNRDTALKVWRDMAARHNLWESRRTGGKA